MQVNHRSSRHGAYMTVHVSAYSNALVKLSNRRKDVSAGFDYRYIDSYAFLTIVP